MTIDITALCAIAERDALEGEQRGCLTEPVIAEALRSSAFNARVPRELGGADLSLNEQFELCERLSYADGGAGWTLSFMALSAGLVSGLVGDEGAAEICDGGTWPRFCGTFPYSGLAERGAGGWRVRGKWGFASGIDHADWLAAGSRTGSAPTDIVWVAVPASEAHVDPTSWDVDGLRATGSKTYALDVFVPDRRCFTVVQSPSVRGRASHRLPTLVYITPEHTGVALGLARRALDEVLALASGKLRMGGRLPLADREGFLRDFGRAQTQLRAARALVVERLAHADALAESASPPYPPQLTFDVRAAAAHAADVATSVASLAYRYGGGSAIGRTHPLHRAWRDVHTATQHVHVNDEVYVSWAEAIAGTAVG